MKSKLVNAIDMLNEKLAELEESDESESNKELYFTKEELLEELGEILNENRR